MKKNRMMRLASILLVCVLLSTSVISGTFAKYTTSDNAQDSARVAKWGINVLVSGNLFGAHYNPNTATTNQDLIVATTANSVSNTTNDGKDIVAPGTKNDTGFTVKVTGTPEVAYKITAKTGSSITNASANEDIFLGKGYWGVMVKVEGLNDASSVAGLYTANNGTYSAANGSYIAGTEYYELHDAVQVTEEKYYPIVWKVASEGSASTAINTTSDLTSIASSMVTNLTKTSMNANADAKANYTLTWEWPFSSTNNVNDGKDTILGNLQVAGNTVVFKSEESADYGTPTDGTNYNLDIVFNFEVVVEQVD